MKISFEGAQKLIVVNPGETFLDLQTDLYIEWKKWVRREDNAKYLQAMSTVGGNKLPLKNLGVTYFLENGWKIRPFEGDHRLIINGNLFSSNGEDPIVDTLGDYKVTIMMSVSNLVDIVSASSVGAVSSDIDLSGLDGVSSSEEWSITTS